MVMKKMPDGTGDLAELPLLVKKSDFCETFGDAGRAMAVAVNGSVNGPDPPIHFLLWQSMGDVWFVWVLTFGRPCLTNMVRLCRPVTVEGSNGKLVSLTHPKHFTMGALYAK